MVRLLKTYLPFTKGVIQEYMAYRMNFYVYLLGNALQTIVLIYIWKAVFDSSGRSVINGFTFSDMFGYVILSMMTGILVRNDVHWAIGMDVRKGDIAMNLIKPVSYHLRMYFAAMGDIAGNFMFVFWPLWLVYTAYQILWLGTWPDPARIGLYLVSVILSSLLMFGINFMFGLAAFYVEYIFGFIFAKEALIRLVSGELIPLAFFPAAILAVFKFLPFAGLVYTPVMIYMGKFTGQELWFNLGIQAIWVVVLLLLSVVIWRRAIKRLRILGG